jgi:hypothetical protein
MSELESILLWAILGAAATDKTIARPDIVAVAID